MNFEIKFRKYLTSEISEIQSLIFGQIQSSFHTFTIQYDIYFNIQNTLGHQKEK